MEEEGRYMAWRSGGRKRERLKGGLSDTWRWTVVDGYRWRGEAETRQQLLRLSALFNSGCLHGQVSREILAEPKRKADGAIIN
jgi:hypothetical protein